MTEMTTTSSEIVITTEYELFLNRYKCRLLLFGLTNSPIKVPISFTWNILTSMAAIKRVYYIIDNIIERENYDKKFLLDTLL